MIIRADEVRDTIETCMLGPRSEDWQVYVFGYIKPHYQVPALADTNMVLAIGYLSHEQRLALAWDFIWREQLSEHAFFMV